MADPTNSTSDFFDSMDGSVNMAKQLSKEMEKMASQFEGMADTMKGIVNLVKKGNEEAKKASGLEQTRLAILGKINEKMDGGLKPMTKMVDLAQSMVKGGMSAWLAWLAVLTTAIDRWIDLDLAAGEFRKETKLLTSQTGDLSDLAQEMNVSMAKYGVGLKEAYGTITAFYKEFQSTHAINKELVKTSTMLEANYGVSSKHVAKIDAHFASILKSAGRTTEDMVLIATSLAKAGGVAPNLVMEDLADASNDTYTFLAKNPMALITATVEARRLGTSINKISDSARQLLNFQDSINAEMEASAMLGQNVNFQYARQLAFQGKIVESRKEALRLISSIGKFTDLNLYQQEALAKAAGMQVEDIIRQQNQQEKLNALKQSDLAAYQKYEKMQKDIESGRKRTLENLAKEAKADSVKMEMQAKMLQLTNALSDAWTSIQESLLPIANVLMPVIVGGVKILSTLIRMIFPIIIPLSGIYKTASMISDVFLFLAITFPKLEKMFMGMATVANIFGFGVAKVGNIFGSIFGWLGKIGSMFKIVGRGISIFGKFVGFLTPFLKAIPIIGWIITGIQFIFALFKRFSDIQWGKSWGENILLGIKAIGGALWDVLVQPFVDVWNWLKNTFLGNSPSELGLGIVRGIKSVGNMLFEALLWPFNKLMGVLSKLPVIGKFFGGVKNFVNDLNPFKDTSMEIKSEAPKMEGTDELVSAIKMLADTISVLNGNFSQSGVVQKTPTTSLNTVSVQDKIDELITLLKDGGIALKIDGQKVNSALARGRNG